MKTLTKTELLDAIQAERGSLITAAQRLVAAASPNPPGDVSAAANAAAALLASIPGAVVSRYETGPGIVNLVACIKSQRPGRRLVFNGHLDTFPIGEDLGWSVEPLGGPVREGRLYGRGVCDMKAGIAASILAASVLARRPDAWCGEIVITLAGDEETMGQLGTKWLLENVAEAKGTAMVSGDVGSPRVVRFGEKGLLWIEVSAVGKAAHGAHVHKGVNAIDRLRAALDAVQRLEQLPVHAPREIGAAVALASALSESLSGPGESRVLQRLTVNIGTIEGGVSPNLVPTQARAQGDIRIPVGVQSQTVIDKLNEWLGPMEGVQWRVVQRYEPSFTEPEHELVQLALSASEHVTGTPAVANMRVGASDARLYRAAGVPTIVLGCTPFGMGAADEYVEVDELVNVAKIHALIALGYLEGGVA
ncbi:MAG: M20 family peptidase [Variovorax sp.]|nr:MAG: M20 family peptidase [Variovorax sp.]